VYKHFLLLAAVLCVLLAGKAGAETAIAAERGLPDAPDGSAADRAASIAASLDDGRLAAQVILSGVDGNRFLSGAMKDLFRAVPPGGIMLFRYNLDAEKAQVRNFLAECAGFVADVQRSGVPETGGAKTAPGVPPFMAVDHEGGFVHRFGPGITRLPAAAYWREYAEKNGAGAALAALEEAAFKSGAEIRDLGITVNLAPVAEMLNAENRSFLGGRSFGEDPLFVEAAAAAFIRGMERAGIICTVKHFPGNTGIDPHESAQTLSGGVETLSEMVKPFSGLVKNYHVPAIMVSHALVPALDPNRIASLSPLVMGKWLREELGFNGIILSDDFFMGAAAQGGRPEDAAAVSLAAGADMVMAWPLNLTRVHRAILAALEDGRLSREKLRESAARIIAEKIRAGILASNE
jgi:beta-N-acetylhexosaminidase